MIELEKSMKESSVIEEKSKVGKRVRKFCSCRE